MKTLFFLILLGCLSILSAHAWDPLGHMVIAQIAEEQLSPAAKGHVQDLIQAFNKQEGADYGFVTAACWMDDIRAKTREYNSWHYVNLPFTPKGTPIPDGEKTPHVIWGIEQCEQTLSGEATPAEKGKALVMFLHLAGDVHQPLHTTQNDDSGGNRVEVSNLESPEVDLLFSKGTNLHFFWDSAYRREFKNGIIGVSYSEPLYAPDEPLAGHQAALALVKERAAELMRKFPPEIVDKQGDAVSWALESHKHGFAFAYGKLPKPQPDNTIRLDENYTAKARALAQKQLALAGYRIGAFLNQRLGAE